MIQRFYYLLFFLPVILNAQTGGQTTYSFLKIPTAARAAGMGGHLISIKDNDLNLVADNPAILDSTLHNNITFSYVNYIQNVDFGYFSYARHFHDIGTFSMGMQFMGYGEFVRADETGQKIGEFRAGDYAFDLSYGYARDSIWSLGATVKFIYSSYDIQQSFGVAMDLGVHYMSKKKFFQAGLVLSNIGYQITPYEGSERQDLPFQIQAAGSYKLPKAPLRFTLLVNNAQTWDLTGEEAINGVPTISPDGQTQTQTPENTLTLDNLFRHFVIGAEILPSDNFYIQFGYNYLRRQELSVASNTTSLGGFSLGTGFRIKKIKFSYAITGYTKAGTSHHFTFTANLNEFKKRKG